MIKTLSDLKYYLLMDRKRYPINNLFVSILTFDEHLRMYFYMVNLRFLEYGINSATLFAKMIFVITAIFYRILRFWGNIFLAPNVAGPGFLIVHPGYFRADDIVHIGNNCTILPMVLFGKKKPGIPNPDIFVGDNCYISTGVTILGPVKIGDNVIIGAGAVITKDIPDNTIVVGVPGNPINKQR